MLTDRAREEYLGNVNSLKEDVPEIKTLLSLKGVSVINGQKKLLDNLNVEMPLGQNLVILGPSGSGKSTFTKLISCHIHPYGGTGLKILGQERISVFDLRKKLGIVSSSEQLYFDGHPPVEVLDCVLSGFFAGRGVWTHHEISDEMRYQADDALIRMGVAHLCGKFMNELSTGEARRILIARALVHRPKALLLDEPCAGLDPAAQSRFLHSLRMIAREGVTLLLVTHHIEEVLPEIDHVLMLRDGKVFKQGLKDKLFNSQILSDLFDIPLQVEKKGEWYYSEIDNRKVNYSCSDVSAD